MEVPAHPTHECGVFAVFDHPNAAELTYYGLYALQHRGQESAGIVTTTGPGETFRYHRGMGLVPQVFQGGKILDQLKGRRAVGHVRYSTAGGSRFKNAQPILVDCAKGQVAVGHNGNLVNANLLRDELEAYGSIFQTTGDSEIIVHLMAQPHGGNRRDSVRYAMGKIEGAFSVVIMTEREIFGVRDIHGFRPLSIGKLDGSYILSSETCAFDLIGAEFIRDVEPGEIVTIDEHGLHSEKPFIAPKRGGMCVFEYVYFARPDSRIEGKTISQVRTRMGAQLAKEHPIEADVVVPIPDSGNYAALGYSEESGIPYKLAFVRNHYVGRTFIQPSQLIRDLGVKVKLNLIAEEVAGKRVVVVDDSIVRGTTAKSRVVTLRQAGAKEVHIRISCPPHKNACYYGIDFPDPETLIANQMDTAAIAEYLGADSLGYLSEDGMIAATEKPESQFCRACFNGKYPVAFDHRIEQMIIERRKERAEPLVAVQPPLNLFE